MSDPSAWPVIDMNERLAEFGGRLGDGHLAGYPGHPLVDELAGLDDFGNRTDPDAGRL
jgi:hypothetical protein